MTHAPSDRPPVIAGTATSPTGPVPMARVTIESSPRPLPDIGALTDEHGRFALGTAGPGHYTIAIHAEGFEVARIECDVDVDDRQVDIELIPRT